jgi:hypothetical protein
MGFVLSVGFRMQDAGIVSPVNIYSCDTLLLVSDAQVGIHVYSVADRAHPRAMFSIPLEGNSGCAMAGGVIYANSYESIIAMRIVGDTSYEVTRVLTGTPMYFNDYYPMGDDVGMFNCVPPLGCVSDAPVAAGGSETGGVGGSYALFAVVDSFLYYVSGYDVVTMDIRSPESPVELSHTYIGWSIETIFPTQSHLFIGGAMGMYVLDRSTPASPRMIGQVQHFQSCDPVVVQDTVAYVTLRGGNTCGANRDELMSVSITDPANPTILQELDVTTPYGLAVRDTLLYLAKGDNGFGLFSVSNPRNMTPIASMITPSRDFIWLGATLFVMGSDRITIFDVTDPATPAMVSEIR